MYKYVIVNSLIKLANKEWTTKELEEYIDVPVKFNKKEVQKIKDLMNNDWNNYCYYLGGDNEDTFTSIIHPSQYKMYLDRANGAPFSEKEKLYMLDNEDEIQRMIAKKLVTKYKKYFK